MESIFPKCFAIPSSFVKFMVTSAIPFAICYKIFHSISSTNPTRMCKTCSSVILSIYLQYVKKYEYSNKPRANLCGLPRFHKIQRKYISYRYFLISSISAVYSSSERNFCCGFIAKTPPHSYSSVYFGTRWKCR